eukprot:CAMPEP_0172553600 /NCGR_PEP_ID=MMETSP1067-20121228/51300_1 /TAXON_ID=265564 ORGANISM="Thalassiosira punctigera, Strain Tpunct2005C2" /NCGR_SAMPLE_ID=MMETSP1067 /ASSEMBLY_ACC=CAM_ASM_000444 /LENGTH=206 /DNA_ID=CAMNT_0013341813 /DNA_START=128 /DNA_END=748 /DNA_ORIENTATION=-
MAMQFTKALRSVVILAALLFTCVGAFSAQPSPERPLPDARQQQPVVASAPPHLPATDDPYALLGLDRLSPPKDFAVVHRAYRSLARRYHPDAAVGPDATPEERERASADFTRISEAYEDLKARRDEEEIEVVLMGGNFAQGKRDRRVRYKTSEKIRQQNPNRVNYDRILELRDRRNLKATSWRDPGEYDYSQGGRHNGDFGPVRRW